MRGNILINDSGTDLSAEGYAALGVLLEMVWGIQTMWARMARTLDEIGARDCLVQRKKQAFNDAKKSINGLLKGLEAAFDETFNYAMCRVPEGTLERTEALQSYADDIVRLLILYYSRVDGDPQGNDKRQRVHKAIANFKPVLLSALASQKAVGKAIFGKGWLISEKKAAEKKAAEKIIVWELSEAEREAVRRVSLDKKNV